ncbi:enoyl-CoA hydratase/isomerase family protein [Desulfonema ishimotonii]|uniref:Enoyl-CoA hydratase/isomerase family protein n=1 Tax=Desulfonema ishimotonii TaxID=45657 RepID=A0A401G434_9BACT|nr:enoyl-CoA hydratase/isomerase family protein [Desulfonema ishimotonii]GBC63990.1 enoyl-CoA hydratase/isomerase family protein [Desulfonema ishimotonii]
MAMVEYTLDGSVAVMTLNSGENRFNPEFLNAVLQVMDEIENETEALTLVVKSAHEKIFSNGIDLEWLIPVVQKNDMQAAKDFFYLLNRLFRRTLTYPMITVAALTGHAFAGGAIWSCAYDFRFMRSDRGYFCFPEVDLGIPFLPGMLGLLRKAIPFYKMEEMHHTAARLTADECEKHHIVTKACHMDTLMDETLAFAKGLTKRREVVREMKARLYRDILHAIDVEDVPYIESEKFNIG